MINKNKFLKKGISTPIGILIILVVILLAGGIITWQFPKLSKEEIVPQENETANWETYKNKEYGFKVKYPGDWFLDEDSDDLVYFDSLNTREKVIKIEEAGGPYEINPHAITIHFTVSDKDKIIETLETLEIEENPLQKKLGTISPGGRQGIQVLEQGIADSEWVRTYIDWQNGILIIDGINKPEIIKTYNQMLSTFKFIESEEKEEITNFEECIASESSINSRTTSMCECDLPDGRKFIKEIESPEDLTIRYTDEEFHFSFYYPKSFEISKSNEYLKGGDIYLTKVGPFGNTIIITKYLGQRVEDSSGRFGGVTYYYDKNKDQWMKDAVTERGDTSIIYPVEPNFYTVSGLPVFPGAGYGITKIVAFSTEKFLIISIPVSGWTSILDPLTKTVFKTDQEIDNEKIKNLLKEEICSLER